MAVWQNSSCQQVYMYIEFGHLCYGLHFISKYVISSSQYIANCRMLLAAHFLSCRQRLAEWAVYFYMRVADSYITDKQPDKAMEHAQSGCECAKENDMLERQVIKQQSDYQQHSKHPWQQLWFYIYSSSLPALGLLSTSF